MNKKILILFLIGMSGFTFQCNTWSAENTNSSVNQLKEKPKLRALVEGVDYEILPEAVSTKPLVMEYFNYACSACYSMERFTSNMMRKKKGLSFGFVPVENHPSWRIYVKAFYIGQMAGVINKSHHDLYDRIHRQKIRFKNEAEMKRYFLALGVSNSVYEKVVKSERFNTLVNNAKERAIKIGLRETPTFVVNNKYKLNIQNLGTYEMLEKAIDELSDFKPIKNLVKKET